MLINDDAGDDHYDHDNDHDHDDDDDDDDDHYYDPNGLEKQLSARRF